MSKIVRNDTASPITVNDVGVTIPASFSYTIPAQDYLLWAASNDAITFIGAGDLIVNDGTSDLTISDGIFLIKGIFPSPVGITNPTVFNLSMPVANTEYNYTFPAALKQFTLKPRGLSSLKLAYVSGETASNFATVPAGAFYHENAILRSATLTVYIQANKANETLELIYWT